MQFRFSWRITVTGLILVLGMLRLSYWQWQRHQAKVEYIQAMADRLAEPVVPLSSLVLKNLPPADLEYRRVSVSGNYDYDKEIILRNRKHGDDPGVLVLTPIKLRDSNDYILTSRGFIPLSLSARDKRAQFRKDTSDSFIGLLKSSSSRRFLAPEDPPAGPDLPWVDAWLRVDIEKIAKQLPYPILPYYVEKMNTLDLKDTQEQIVSSQSNRDEIFLLAQKEIAAPPKPGTDLSGYPIAVFDTVVPPGRHFGYVIEWAIMAFATILICLILQMKRPPKAAT